MTRYHRQTKIYSNILAIILALATVLPAIPDTLACTEMCCCQAMAPQGTVAHVQLSAVSCCHGTGGMPCGMNTAQPPDIMDDSLIVSSKTSDPLDASKLLATDQIQTVDQPHNGLGQVAGRWGIRTIPIYLHTATLLC